jgi:hypothetical protein
MPSLELRADNISIRGDGVVTSMTDVDGFSVYLHFADADTLVVVNGKLISGTITADPGGKVFRDFIGKALKTGLRFDFSDDDRSKAEFSFL